MQDQELLEKLKTVILPYIDDNSLLENASMDAHLTRDLNVNSASIVDIVLDVEEMFDIEISDEQIGEMETIGSCIAILKQNLAVLS